jgi:tetratricopeptide (TPR) repeat protein
MQILFLVVPLLTESIGGFRAGDIAEHCGEIMAEYRKSLPAALHTRAEAEALTRQRDEKLRGVLATAGKLPPAHLSAEDCVALSEAAERLRRPKDALAFATLAVSKSRSFAPYVAFVRGLLALGRLEEAESAIRDAVQACPDEKELYLLHHVAAIKYRSLQRYERAYEHLRRVPGMLTDQFAKSAFYVSHFGRCLEDLEALAAKSGQQGDFTAFCGELHEKLANACDHQCAAIRRERGSFSPTATELVELARRREALLALAERKEGREVEAILEAWLDMLHECDPTAENASAWLAQVALAVKRVASSLMPGMLANRVDERVVRVLQSVRELDSSDREIGEAREEVQAQLTATIRLIEQHRRHQALIGQSLLPPDESQRQAGATGSGMLLLCIFHPLTENLATQFRAWTVAKNDLDRAKIRVRFASLQCGLACDEATRRFYVQPGQSSEQELAAVRKLASKLSVPGQVGLLLNESAAMKSLQPEAFPINVLLDERGTIVAILTGPERKKLLRLLRVVESRPVAGE